MNLSTLLDVHQKYERIATVTAVRPPARFGRIELGENGRVESFIEKPQSDSGWINGGFFVLEPEIFEYLEGPDTVLKEAL